MRILIELPLTIALFTMALKAGWPWTVVFVLGYILAFAFKLPFLSTRVQVSTRFLAFLAIFLAFSLTASASISHFLFSEDGQAWIAAGKLRIFLLETNTLKVLWAAVAGFSFTALASALILIPYGLVAGQQMYSQYDQYKGHEGDAAKTAIGALLGISRGTWIVSNGQAEVKGDPGGSLTRFGGPGILIVQEGHAVILEISGKLSRVAGRGIAWLKPFERISMVVPLQVRGEHIILERVTTQDRVSIDEFEFWVYHKVDAGLEEEWVSNGLAPYNPRILIEMVWSPGGNDWSKAVRSVAETVGRDVIGRHTLEQLVTISDSFRSQLKQELIDAINEITKEKMGINVAAVDFGTIKLSSFLESKLVEMWTLVKQEEIARAEGRIRVINSRAQAQALESIESARALAQRQMILAITQALPPGAANARPVVLLRFLEALEKISQDPAMKVLFPYELPVRDIQGILTSGDRQDKSDDQHERRSSGDQISTRRGKVDKDTSARKEEASGDYPVGDADHSAGGRRDQGRAVWTQNDATGKSDGE